MIWVKDFCIFEDYKTKKSIKLSDYSNNLPTFQGFCYKDDDEELEKTIPCTSWKVNAREENPKTRTEEGQEALQLLSLTLACVNNAETKAIGQNPCAGVEPKIAIETPQKSRTNHTIKPSTKALEAIRQAKTHKSNQNSPQILQRDADIGKFII